MKYAKVTGEHYRPTVGDIIFKSSILETPSDTPVKICKEDLREVIKLGEDGIVILQKFDGGWGANIADPKDYVLYRACADKVNAYDNSRYYKSPYYLAKIGDVVAIGDVSSEDGAYVGVVSSIDGVDLYVSVHGYVRQRVPINKVVLISRGLHQDIDKGDPEASKPRERKLPTYANWDLPAKVNDRVVMALHEDDEDIGCISQLLRVAYVSADGKALLEMPGVDEDQWENPEYLYLVIQAND